MPYYDVQSTYEPGQLVTQSQGTQFTLPGVSGQPGMGLDLSGFGQGLGQLAQQSLDMRRQQAMQQMALQQRAADLQAAQFNHQAGLQDAQFDYQKQRDAMGDRQAKQARLDAENAAYQAKIAAENQKFRYDTHAKYGQLVGGPNVVPGMISASGNTPGAVYTGWRSEAQGPTTFQGGMGESGASLGAGLMPGHSPGFAPPAPSTNPYDMFDNAGFKTAEARRQLLALNQPQQPQTRRA